MIVLREEEMLSDFLHICIIIIAYVISIKLLCYVGERIIGIIFKLIEGR
jgi:hypothetical protein